MEFKTTTKSMDEDVFLVKCIYKDNMKANGGKNVWFIFNQTERRLVMQIGGSKSEEYKLDILGLYSKETPIVLDGVTTDDIFKEYYENCDSGVPQLVYGVISTNRSKSCITPFSVICMTNYSIGIYEYTIGDSMGIPAKLRINPPKSRDKFFTTPSCILDRFGHADISPSRVATTCNLTEDGISIGTSYTIDVDGIKSPIYVTIRFNMNNDPNVSDELRIRFTKDKPGVDIDWLTLCMELSSHGYEPCKILSDFDGVPDIDVALKGANSNTVSIKKGTITVQNPQDAIKIDKEAQEQLKKYGPKDERPTRIDVVNGNFFVRNKSISMAIQYSIDTDHSGAVYNYEPFKRSAPSKYVWTDDDQKSLSGESFSIDGELQTRINISGLKEGEQVVVKVEIAKINHASKVSGCVNIFSEHVLKGMSDEEIKNGVAKLKFALKGSEKLAFEL